MEIEQIILEKQRRQIWIEAWCSVASAWNCPEPENATRWADVALKEFDDRFKLNQEGVTENDKS